jgi:acyl-CoA synthetase (AMP-forming)/AMP-acid ligase II
LGRGDKFNLHLGNSPEFLFFCWLAAAKTGTVMAPTNPASTADEMACILARSEARLSITEPQCPTAVREASARGSAPPNRPRAHRLVPGAPVRLQGARADRVPRELPAHAGGQDPEASVLR